MNVALHLIAMPWARLSVPSMPIAALKAHVDAVFGTRVRTRTYSAFVELTLDGSDFYRDDRYGKFGESSYFLLCFRRFLRRRDALRRIPFDKVFARFKKHFGELVPSDIQPPTWAFLDGLERRTRRYVERALVPNLDRGALNLIGFTLNYHQVYSSIYCALYLAEKFPRYRKLFLFGGASAAHPKAASVMRKCGMTGLGVIGEGETKLARIVETCLKAPEETTEEKLWTELSGCAGGIYRIQDGAPDLRGYHPEYFESQLPSFDRVPVPDFEEYFQVARKRIRNAKAFVEFKNSVTLPVEGSRGCFSKCDFCNLNASWNGFRRDAPERIAERALKAMERHRVFSVKFLDNVCDAWAEKYADGLIGKKITIPSFMELRAHHPEIFWTKLALAGVERVQIGVEALAPGLLKAINKGTTVRQNLLAMKWLKELNVKYTFSNIMTHHPRSTVADVEDTRRIVEKIPHFERLQLVRFQLAAGSPLFAELAPEDLNVLVSAHIDGFPADLRDYLLTHWGFPVPRKWANPDVIRRWDGFKRWYERFFESLGGLSEMSVSRCGIRQLLIRDRRYGETEEYFLEGDDAVIYDLCHQGLGLDALSRLTRFPDEKILGIVRSLQRQNLLLEADGAFLALALRPRDELVGHYHDALAAENAGPERFSATNTMESYG